MSTVNLDFANCIRAVQQFGYERIYNVCNGTTTVVPWGFFAWLGAGLLLTLLASIVAGVVWWNYPYWKYRRKNRK